MRHGAEPLGTRLNRFWNPVRLARYHPRLAASIGIGVATYLLLCVLQTDDGRTTTRVLIGWDVGVTVYLVLAMHQMSAFDLKLVRRRAAIQDEGALLILVLTTAAAVASLVAIVAEIGAVRGHHDPHEALYVALAVATCLLSWTFIHLIFAFHYAHEFHGEGDRGGGLVFPDDPEPDYWDFAYFSFVVGMTFQVSDVQVTSKLLRRIVVVHGLVSFVYNVAILALIVNLGSDFI